ncbi:uncharacterized protein LOC126195762 [Schistocerca nitens]|uniref:uncharacterized protein LOC126195762 n=1 Tax=Schistocerca nitens TaxID=7011 RepID=UPI002118573B|nr:uncharacterized protein LOC126195762 [Schistocerca nitens]
MLRAFQRSVVVGADLDDCQGAVRVIMPMRPPRLRGALCRFMHHLVRGGFQPRLPTSLPPPGQQQQQQPSPLPRRQPVPLMPPAQLHTGAPRVVAPAPAVPLQSPPPSEQMDVDPSAGPPSQAVAVQPVLQPLSLGTPKESDTAAPCPAPTQQPSTQLGVSRGPAQPMLGCGPGTATDNSLRPGLFCYACGQTPPPPSTLATSLFSDGAAICGGGVLYPSQ